MPQSRGLRMSEFVLFVYDGGEKFQQGTYYSWEAADEVGDKYWALMGWSYEIEERGAKEKCLKK